MSDDRFSHKSDGSDSRACFRCAEHLGEDRCWPRATPKPSARLIHVMIVATARDLETRNRITSQVRKGGLPRLFDVTIPHLCHPICLTAKDSFSASSDHHQIMIHGKRLVALRIEGPEAGPT